MTGQVTKEELAWDPKLGPQPLPTAHGKGCICRWGTRDDCPALATPHGQDRERERKLNAAEARVRDANKRVAEAYSDLCKAEQDRDAAWRAVLRAAGLPV